MEIDSFRTDLHEMLMRERERGWECAGVGIMPFFRMSVIYGKEHLMYVDDFYAFVKQIHHEIHRRPAKQSPICCTIRYVYGCCSCLVARVICFSCTSSLCLFILCVRMQVAQSTFFIFILGDLYSSGVSVCVCRSSVMHAYVRAYGSFVCWPFATLQMVLKWPPLFITALQLFLQVCMRARVCV